jgi:hypothetical protein
VRVPVANVYSLRRDQRGFWVGGTTWADLPFHLNIMSSFLYGANAEGSVFRPLASVFFSNSTLAYPYLPDFHTALNVAAGRCGFVVHRSLCSCCQPEYIAGLQLRAGSHATSRRFAARILCFVAVLSVHAPGAVTRCCMCLRAPHHLYRWLGCVGPLPKRLDLGQFHVVRVSCLAQSRVVALTHTLFLLYSACWVAGSQQGPCVSLGGQHRRVLV